MHSRNRLIDEGHRQINALSTTNTRVTLLSATAPHLPTSVLAAAVQAAATPVDLIGDLGDGSIALLSLCSHGPDAGAGVEHRFLMHLQDFLTPLARRGDIGPVFFRAVHRWTCELGDFTDLFASLRNAPAIPINISPQPAPHLPSPVASALRFLLHRSTFANGTRIW
ncbi:hypothetical protein [Telmatospirillum sp.]|uniref:hypothetical protein n=1 Tax=Telmatospirillum sp. TaxID=2079197 RepID=UPI0028430CDB|nr:hypothetical protein [Telmatospirillum sp.]MDR3440526.1 hypothetical protein [Telmatospirillum sp.]